MNAVQWGTPTIVVEKVLDTNPNVHLMNLEDALREKRYEEAVIHLKYAWEVGNSNEKVKRQCIDILKLLKKLGYAKDIHWDREERIEKLLTCIGYGIGGVIVYYLVYYLCVKIWDVQIAKIVAILVAAMGVLGIIIEEFDIKSRIYFGIYLIMVCMTTCIIVYYLCAKIWNVQIAKIVTGIFVAMGVLGTIIEE